MRKTLFLALSLAFFLVSVSAATDSLQEDEAVFAIQQAANQIQTALRSNNRTHTRSAISTVVSSLEALFKHNSCYWMVSSLISQLEILPFKIQEKSFGFMDALNMELALNSANRDCFPIVNFARKLINRAAKALNISQQLIPKLRGNKLVSFDVQPTTTTTGKAILAIQDAVRFGECVYATGLFGIYASLMTWEPKFNTPGLLYAGAMIGFEAVEGCKEAVRLAHEVFTEAQKEHKVLSEINKISTALFAEGPEKKDEASFKTTLQGALDTISDITYAGLCYRELYVGFYQYFFLTQHLPADYLSKLFDVEFILSVPYSANQDCLPFANAIKYAFIELKNAILGSNSTFVPIEGAILKKSNFGISSDSTIGLALTALSTPVEAWRCILASAMVYPLAETGYTFWKYEGASRALDMFELSALEALAGGTSCVNVYKNIRQLFGESKKKTN